MTDEAVQGLKELTDRWRVDPVAFVHESYRCDPEGAPVEVDEPQAKILRAIAEHDKVVVRSSHGIGKTATASWVSKWWVATRTPALVVTSAGTWGHLEDKLWPEIKTWSQNWRLREAFEWQEMGVYSKITPSSWRIEAASSDQAVNVEGFHSPNLLIIIDEAKGMPDEIWAALRGALTSVSKTGAKPKVLVLSTPPLAKVGWYADLFGSKSSGWKTIHISGFESSRVSKDWIEEMRNDFGEDSPTYQSKVLGEIPEGAASAVIQGRWIEAAQKAPAKPSKKPIVVTCDVAREGEDLTVIGRIKDCKFEIRKWKAKNDTMEVVGMCKSEVIASGAHYLVIDDTGVGGGCTDRLLEMQRQSDFPAGCTIVPLKFGVSADRDDRFHLSKDELWWSTRDALKSGLLALPSEVELAALALPRGSTLKAQLAAPIYEEDSRSRIKVYDKRTDNREKTRALPTKSPDLAHALILGVKLWTRLADLVHPKTYLKEDGSPDYAAWNADRLKRALEERLAPAEEAGSERYKLIGG